MTSNIDNKPLCRFCVAVRRLAFPPEALAIGPGSKAWVQPAHLVTLLAPASLTNLLPCPLHYSVREGGGGAAVPAGGEISLHLDTSATFTLDLCLEGFPGRGSVIFHPGAASFEARIQLADTAARPLHLTVRLTVRYGGALFISVFAPFWIINKTGLPLVFREENEKTEAAGQAEEHELARMVAPLLFSFPDRDSSLAVVARVGRGLQPTGRPSWCRQFYLQSGGSTVRRLRVQPGGPDRRPDWVYIVGIDCRPGRGRYAVTTILTLSPRFQLHNQSRYKIQFAQQCFATSFQDPGAERTFLTAHTQSSLAFHWPRLDQEQLLCMKLTEVPGCQWSGGFPIETVDSFQLASRDADGRSRFLRVEIRSVTRSGYCT